MCGICGTFSPNGVLRESTVTGMMKVLEHRGPDGKGSYVSPKCELGHQRLAVIDLTGRGTQPMHNEKKTVWAVVNGEIYNYKELRDRLQYFGHTFISECDSEVITHAYEHFGDSFLVWLRGMFVLALLDSEEGKLILARDIAGKKPLYYYQDAARLVFASEIKALFEAGVPKDVNYAALQQWLMYQYSLGDSTLFGGIKKIPAAHMLICQNGSTKLLPYWKLPQTELMLSKQESVTELRGLLEESVRLRLQSDVPVGSFLSGGIDSSAVTALYRSQYTGDLHTFTATFDTPSSQREAEAAALVSRHLETIHHEVPITGEMVAQDMRHVTWHNDEPIGDAATLCNYYLAKEAKRYVTVVLAGEGGDEVFGGYPWYRSAAVLKAASVVPFRRLMRHLVNGDITGKHRRVSRMMSVSDNQDLDEILLYPTTAMSRREVEWLLKSEYSTNERASALGRSPNAYARMLESDFLNLLPEKFLMKADKGTMAWAVEERLPLLDAKVVAFAFSLPSRLKQDKQVLRDAVADLLPDGVAGRPKQGFGTPVGEWLRRAPLKEMLLDRLQYGKLLRMVCRDKSLAIITNYVAGTSSRDRRLAFDPMGAIWGLFALEVWYDLWFGSSPV